MDSTKIVQAERKSKLACIFPRRRLSSVLRSDIKDSASRAKEQTCLRFFRGAAYLQAAKLIKDNKPSEKANLFNYIFFLVTRLRLSKLISALAPASVAFFRGAAYLQAAKQE
jgi:hypothetical protein